MPVRGLSQLALLSRHVPRQPLGASLLVGVLELKSREQGWSVELVCMHRCCLCMHAGAASLSFPHSKCPRRVSSRSLIPKTICSTAISSCMLASAHCSHAVLTCTPSDECGPGVAATTLHPNPNSPNKPRCCNPIMFQLRVLKPMVDLAAAIQRSRPPTTHMSAGEVRCRPYLRAAALF